MAQVQSYRLLRILVAGAMFLLGLCLLLGPEEAHGQDFGLPDSVYYLPCRFAPLACSGEVAVHIPVYLWSDWPALSYAMRLQVTGYTGCDSTTIYLLRPCSSPSFAQTCNNSDTLGWGVVCSSWEVLTPGSGLVGEFFIRAFPGDTIALALKPPLKFTLTNFSEYWYPLYNHLDTQFVVPTEFDIPPGDVDASGLVTISDAVFLIQYIFAGGCTPFDLNAADPNGDCSNTISDVVYLINYIFAGGPPPQAGCVGL